MGLYVPSGHELPTVGKKVDIISLEKFFLKFNLNQYRPLGALTLKQKVTTYCFKLPTAPWKQNIANSEFLS